MAEQTEPPQVRPNRSGRPRPRRNGAATQALMRERLIESRLTPNAISLTGFALNIAAAALVVGRLFFLAGHAFIVFSITDTLDGPYSRMSGKGTPFGAFLDSTLDRMEEGIVLTAVGAYRNGGGGERCVARSCTGQWTGWRRGWCCPPSALFSPPATTRSRPRRR